MDDGLKRKVVGILAQGRHLALATVREDGYPQVNTVSYAFDGLVLYFGTSRYSTKIRNIQRCGKISLAITLPYDDWSQIQGLSMAAIAHVLADDAAGSARAMNMLRQRFSAAWDVSPPTGPGQIVFVELVPSIVSLIDYTKAFSYSETVEIGAGDLNAPSARRWIHRQSSRRYRDESAGARFTRGDTKDRAIRRACGAHAGSSRLFSGFPSTAHLAAVAFDGAQAPFEVGKIRRARKIFNVAALLPPCDPPVQPFKKMRKHDLLQPNEKVPTPRVDGKEIGLNWTMRGFPGNIICVEFPSLFISREQS
ncbi:blr4240; hypothetical protein [Caballeronia glathei]|nr:blr4240; hypothetical protein [Caballeronia glathei]